MRNLYAYLILLIQLWATKIWYCFISVKFATEEKWTICRYFVADVMHAFIAYNKGKLVFLKY